MLRIAKKFRNKIIAVVLLTVSLCLTNLMADDAFEPLTVQDETLQAAESGETYTVRQIKLEGNSLLSEAEIISNLPNEYVAVEDGEVYNFRPIKGVLGSPQVSYEVPVKSIEGLLQHIVAQYANRDYAGVYVYIPIETIAESGELVNGTLVLRIIEAPLGSSMVKIFDPNGTEKEKGYLRKSAVESWSPAKQGQVVNRKKVDDFVNLLNLNPDRYVAAVVSSGDEPNALNLSYEIYEANPWHWFVQVDNSGTDDRQWAPRVGLINTNLLGIDDTFTAVYQAKPDSTFDDDYALFGSYDFPVLGPKLRLNVFGGYNEFDVDSGTSGYNFLGRGSFVGADLRYNVLQCDEWLWDVIAGLSYEESRVSPSIFPTFLTTDLEIALWHLGTEVYRSQDMVDNSLTFDVYQSFNGSDDSEFNLARSGADSDFTIYELGYLQSQYFDKYRVHRITGRAKWRGSDDRLPPAKMTTFGGMYSVRGYDEYEVVADGGLLGSLQYEFDIISYQRSKQGRNVPAEKDKQFVRKLAPLVFVDAAKARNKDDLTTGERREVNMASVGGGLLLELGNNFVSGLFAGYPLRSTEETREGKGRLNVFFMLRF